MEKVYYKSKIYEVTEFQNCSFSLSNMVHFGFNKMSDEFLTFFYTLKFDIRDKFIKEIAATSENDITDLSKTKYEEIKKFIDMQFKKLSNKNNKEIIFEIIKTKNGDLYGKELLTGLLFPICDLNKIKYKLSRSYITNAVESKSDKEIFFVKDFKGNYSHESKYTIENYKKIISVTYSKHSCRLYSYDLIPKYYYSIRPLTTYSLKPVISPFENLSLCELILFKPEVANKNEIEKYLNRFNGFLKNGKKKKFVQKITKLYNKNIFNSEIEIYVPVSEVKKERIEKDKINLKLENIEYLLMLLKQKNLEMYNKYIKEYAQLINSENESLTLTPLTIENLTILEGKIEYELNNFKRNADNILDLLHNLKTEYLENFQNKNEKTTKLSISDIDKLNESFLKIKSEYSVKEQLQIQKDIVFLYIMEIIEDDDIKLSDLENSYFKDNLKYVIIVILSLIDEDIIKDNIMINFEMELDLCNVYNIIKDIEFKKSKQKIK